MIGSDPLNNIESNFDYFLIFHLIEDLESFVSLTL